MNKYRYTLAKRFNKVTCPSCGKAKRFVRYVDTQTEQLLPEQYGRCERINNCGYHLNPYKDGYAKEIRRQEFQSKKISRQEFQNKKVTKVTKVTTQKNFFYNHQPTKPVFFDFETFKQTLQPEHYEKNRFIQNLLYNVPYPFNIEDVTKVIELYYLGTVAKGYRGGSITFPFIDIEGNVRAIQAKQFDEQNHTIGTDFLHSIIEKHHTRNNKPLPEWLQAYIKQDLKVSCLFGEHILSKYPNNPVALVEAPKTAVYGTLYFGFPDENPDNLIWLAVYNASSFSFEKLKVLQGRFIYVFPDLSKEGKTYKEWATKAKEYESRLPRTKFVFSDLLEQLAPEQDKIKGLDLADYLITLDWRKFKTYEPTNIKTIQADTEPEPKPEPQEWKIELIKTFPYGVSVYKYYPPGYKN